MRNSHSLIFHEIQSEQSYISTLTNFKIFYMKIPLYRYNKRLPDSANTLIVIKFKQLSDKLRPWSRKVSKLEANLILFLLQLFWRCNCVSKLAMPSPHVNNFPDFYNYSVFYSRNKMVSNSNLFF
jgi:hypothetical protein